MVFDTLWEILALIRSVMVSQSSMIVGFTVLGLSDAVLINTLCHSELPTLLLLEKYSFMSRQLCLFLLWTPVDEQRDLAGTSHGNWSGSSFLTQPSKLGAVGLESLSSVSWWDLFFKWVDTVSPLRRPSANKGSLIWRVLAVSTGFRLVQQISLF